MSPDFGGGFNALRAPMMSRGDKDSVDESKMLDPIMADTRVSGGNDPHGDASRDNDMAKYTPCNHSSKVLQFTVKPF